MTDNPRDQIVAEIGPMRAFAYSLTRNHALADDMVQDALIKAWSHFDKFEPDSNLRAWLFTILRNTVRSHNRKSWRDVEDVEGRIAGRLAQKPDHDGRLQIRDFDTAFAQLPIQQQEALVLVGAVGFSYEEAADLCEVKVGTIKSRLARARSKLVELLDMDDDGDLDMTDAVTKAVIHRDKS